MLMKVFKLTFALMYTSCLQLKILNKNFEEMKNPREISHLVLGNSFLTVLMSELLLIRELKIEFFELFMA